MISWQIFLWCLATFAVFKMSPEFSVKLHIYDVSRGLARQMSSLLLGKQIDGIWHTGIVVYGKEFVFGSGGIDHCAPCETIYGEPDEILDMGVTQIPEDIFRQYLISLGEKEFCGQSYNLFEHNCNNFSNEVAQFLTGSTIPKHIQELPREVLDTPFGVMIKPMLDSFSVGPYSTSIEPSSVTSTMDHATPLNAQSPANTSDLQKSQKAEVQLLKEASPVVFDSYEIASLTSSFEEIIEEGKLSAREKEQANEIKKILMSEEKLEVARAHLQLLENILESYESSGKDTTVTRIIQIFSVLVLRPGAMLLVCKNPEVSRLVFKLVRDFPRFSSEEVQCAIVELLTNICSSDDGRSFLVANEDLRVESSLLAGEGTSEDSKGLDVEHEETVLDHRDVIELTVEALLGENKKLFNRATALVHNASMAKVSQESALECSSAILECLRREDLETSEVYRCLFTLRNFMKSSSEIVNLTKLLDPDLSRFSELTTQIQELCVEMKQYLIA